MRDKVDFAFEHMGEQSVKNMARPVRVCRVRDTAIAKSPNEQTLPALPLPDKPSLAVLPFQNMTGDAEQDYFVDGVVKEITTAKLPFGLTRSAARDPQSYPSRWPTGTSGNGGLWI